MTYDPRAKGLADGLYPERTGKTTRVVATLAARDAIPSGEKYDGMLVQVLENRKLYSWDAANATWDTITGGSGIAKFATLADLQAATGMTDGDFATTLDTDKLYRYTNGAWVEFTAGGSGGGVAKYDTINDILTIVNPEECDLAIARDSGIMMQFHDGEWVMAYNAMTNPQAGGNWELVNRIKCVSGTTPTASFDISGCDKFKVRIIVVGAPSALFGLLFDSDATANYASQDVYGQGTAAAANRTVRSRLMHVDPTYNDGYSELEFDKRAKTGMFVWQYGKVLSDVNAVTYTGSAAMNSLTPTGTGSFNGYIEVHKWVENAKPVELVSYELVKEYKLSNQVLNDTFAWDGDVDDECIVTSDFTCASTTNLLLVLNGDTTAANYSFTNVYGTGTAAASSSGTAAAAGVLVGSIGTAGLNVNNTARLQLGSNRRRGSKLSCAYGLVLREYASSWNNTVSVVSSANINSNGVAITGTVRLYKMVKSRLVTTNPNLATTALSYVDANTVQVQTGELEINGAIMKVTKPTSVALSGNLKSGLTEAANTRYYMYAVRPSKGTVPTYVFDTAAPLMDRYGNLAASFDDIDIARAWFHPSLGFMHRYIGYVDNDASSNIKSFAKQSLAPTGSGGGITKYATMEDIRAVSSPAEGDMALALDTGMTMQYRDGTWVSAFNSLIDPTAQSGWVLEKKIKCVAGVVPTGAIDITGCDKFRVEMEAHSTPSAYLYVYFDGDNGNTYDTQQLLSQGGSTTSAKTAAGNAGVNFMPSASNQTTMIAEFDKRNKVGTRTRALGGTSGYLEYECIRYIGSAAMNTLTFAGAGSFDGYISVYKWVEGVKPVEIVSEELVKEITLNNQILDITIPWDGEIDDMLHITCAMGDGVSTNVFLVLNGDAATANYPYAMSYANGATPAAYLGTGAGMTLGSAYLSSFSDAVISLRSGKKRTSLAQIGRSSMVALLATQWSNTTSPVTSLRLHSNGVAAIGVIRLFKRVKTHLVSTNPNILTTSITYMDANTVAVQPGEIEINGAVMRVPAAKQVTLSGNLKSGLTEAANTRYYMYAVRPETGSTVSFMFDTQAPLMDRYGNTVASFEDCTAKRAWYHPTLGLNYRWIGQVLNDASSNILAYTKCMPGYWEGAYAATPAVGSAYAVPHAFGKAAFKPRVLLKNALADAADHECPPYFSVSASYGAHVGSYGSVAIPAKSVSAVSVLFATNVFFHDGAWKAAGYYKLILTEE